MPGHLPFPVETFDPRKMVFIDTTANEQERIDLWIFRYITEMGKGFGNTGGDIFMEMPASGQMGNGHFAGTKDFCGI